jgi:hypothetical protein
MMNALYGNSKVLLRKEIVIPDLFEEPSPEFRVFSRDADRARDYRIGL